MAYRKVVLLSLILSIVPLSLLAANEQPSAANQGAAKKQSSATSQPATKKQPSVPQHREEPILSFLGDILTFPLQVSWKLLGPMDSSHLDLPTAYKRYGFTQKDQDYFQLNWYADSRMGYSYLHELKERDEEIAREIFRNTRHDVD